jgi:hypothetical protein
MRWSPTLLYIALAVFLASSMATLLSLENHSRRWAVAGAIGNLIAGVLFILCILLPRRKIDWSRIEAEQRLWESGPLGRKWLRMRRRIENRWKP